MLETIKSLKLRVTYLIYISLIRATQGEGSLMGFSADYSPAQGRKRDDLELVSERGVRALWLADIRGHI